MKIILTTIILIFLFVNSNAQFRNVLAKPIEQALEQPAGVNGYHYVPLSNKYGLIQPEQIEKYCTKKDLDFMGLQMGEMGIPSLPGRHSCVVGFYVRNKAESVNAKEPCILIAEDLEKQSLTKEIVESEINCNDFTCISNYLISKGCVLVQLQNMALGNYYESKVKNCWQKKEAWAQKMQIKFKSKSLVEKEEIKLNQQNRYVDSINQLIANGELNGNFNWTYYNQNRSSKIYEGNWLNGKFDGYGKLSIIDNPEPLLEWGNFGNSRFIYTGNFKNGLFDGEGTLHENYIIYKGNFKKGKKHGFFTAEQWTLGGLIEDRWELEFQNDNLISKTQTKNDLTKLRNELLSNNESSSSNETNNSHDEDLKEQKIFLKKRLNKIQFEKTFQTVLNLECPCEKYSYPSFWDTDVYYYKTKENKWFQNGKTFQMFRTGPFNSLEEAIIETEYKNK